MTDREPDRSPEVEPDRLHALFRDAVADVRPEPALDRIRARTKVTPMRQRRPWFLVTAGAVAATAATITVVGLANNRSPQADAGPGPAATTTATPSDPATEEPSDGASPSESPSPDPSVQPDPAGTVAVPVYFVGDTPTGPRLFREFHGTSAAGGPSTLLLAALEQAVRGEAADPDYRSGWAGSTDPDGPQVLSAGTELAPDSGHGSMVVIGIGAQQDLRLRPPGTDETEAVAAVQQLVYTAQAVLQERVPVLFVGQDGRPLDTLLGVDVSDPVREVPAADIQAPVWVTTPQDGDRVGRVFTVEGRGAFFEANVSWQLLGADGAVVKEGFATAQECCTLSPYSFDVLADPGQYVLRVYAADVSDGEGPGEQEDTKRITVR